MNDFFIVSIVVLYVSAYFAKSGAKLQKKNDICKIFQRKIEKCSK